MADKYVVKVQMEAGPFKMDEEHRSVLEKGDLRLQ